MSVAIKISHAVKKYGNNTVIPDLSLDIREGEFFTLLGPSGCGKTTLLRMIAGFNSIEGGDFYFNEKRINDVEPNKRNIGMVFQNYAIFPHLTVRQNVGFGLKNRKCSKEEMESRTDEYLKLMQIEEYKDRLPERLSGGQQQRVALARALVIHPDVLLMDEPLSNLDAKLRVEMRSAIKDIQNQVGITTVYVTHDQEEAMAVSDRIAVFDHGVIQQIGTPQQLYQRPKNLFTATFIGRTNIVEGTLSVGGNGTGSLVLAKTCGADITGLRGLGNGTYPVKVSVRPEEFVIHESGKAGAVEAVVESSIFLGLNTHYNVRLATGERVDIIQESTIDHIIKPQTKISLTVKQEKINILSEDGSRNYLVGVEDDEE
ncbi:ABC transporter ATP-binding protein [Enterocloster asparagiformis]|uniref:ABC transporter ATP-binding protein n=1 Tax=Enterocloster asparagiformis TaxID=333367 RepID=UPI002A7F82FD|nr:ABC transporter ATP-binding protein [Enterocloster asparagiformis]